MAARVDVTEVSKGELAVAVREGWEDGDNALMQQRADYWVNLAFYQGHQWVWWDKERNQLNRLDRKSERERVKATANKIQPRVNSLLGRLTTRPLGFEVRPSAVDDATLQAASIGSHVLEARRTDDGWEEIRSDALFSAFLGGTSAVIPDWDPKRNEVVLEAYNVAEFTLEPGCRRPRDARWMCVARALPVRQAQARYGLKATPKATTATASSPLHRRMATRGMSTSVETCTVYTYWQRPDSDGNGGRVATVIDDEVVELVDWPYPFDELPGYVFRALIVPMQWMGDTPVNSARPIQVARNAIRSTMLENAKLAGNNRMLVPIGSGLDDYEFTDEPGEMVPYIPGDNAKPEWMQAPSLPRDFRYEIENLDSELDDILYTHATSRGEAPGDRNSGLALSILAEKDDTPLGVLARDQQSGWQRIGSHVLQLYAQKIKKPRVARVTGVDAVPVTIEWTGKMLGGEFDVHVPLDAVMPHSKAAMNAMLVDLKQSFPEQFQNIDAPTFLKLIGLHSMEGLREAMDDDVACAVYENTMMAQGEVMIPERWHDHAKHIAEHNRERNSTRFRLSSQDVKDTFEDHMQAHKALIADEMAETQELNAAMPGLGAMPDPNERMGSLVPPDHIDGASMPMLALPAGPRPPV